MTKMVEDRQASQSVDESVVDDLFVLRCGSSLGRRRDASATGECARCV
jgi:hypothetical protein